MRYCLNPACSSPENADRETCQNCGSTLRLKGEFVALRSIGQGGFGRTFLAEDGSDRRCVIKQFFPQQWGNRERASELFRQEALRLEELGEHPQIPNLIAYLEQDNHQYLIQEFIDGCNLDQELAAEGTFSEAQIRQLLLDLLPVLQFMHDRQVIHRDIKPANIIRRNRNRSLVLVDMGAAKYASETALARTGTVIGSAEYVAPEQTRGKAVFASDLYSLGATCIHLMTQMSPFDLYDSSEGSWVWRDCLKQRVSDRFARVLDKMLAEATKRRYQSATEVLQDLTIANRSIPISSQPQAQTLKSSQAEHEPQTQSPFSLNFQEPLTPGINAEHERWLAEHERRTRSPFSLNAEKSDLLLYDPSASRIARRHGSISYVEGKVASSALIAFIATGIFTVGIFLTTSLQTGKQPENNPLPSDPQLPVPVQPSRSQPKTSIPSIEPASTLRIFLSNYFLGFTPEGNLVNVGNVSDLSIDLRIQILNPASNKVLRSFTSSYSGESFRRVALSSDGKFIAASLNSNFVEIRDLQRGTRIRTLAVGQINPATGQPGEVRSLVISPDGKTLIISASNNTIQFWNLQTGRSIRTVQTASESERLTISPDGKTIVGISVNSINFPTTSNIINLRDRNGKLIRTVIVPSGKDKIGRVIGFKVSPDSQTLITASSTGITYVWNLQTGKLVRQLIDKKWQQGDVDSSGSAQYPSYRNSRPVAVTPDGKFLFTTGIYDSILVWDLQQGKLIQTFAAGEGGIRDLLVSPDGKHLVVELAGQANVWSIDRLISGN